MSEMTAVPEEKEKRSHKLSPQEQMAVAQRIAWFWRECEIVKFVREQCGKKISDNLLSRYKDSPKWRPVIEKFREDYLKMINEVPLANKRIRLEELQKMYNRAVKKSDFQEARQVLRDFRDEMQEKKDGVSFNFTQITHNEFHKMTDEDLQREKVKTLEQLEKVRKLKLLAHGGDDGLGSERTPEAIEIEETEES